MPHELVVLALDDSAKLLDKTTYPHCLLQNYSNAVNAVNDSKVYIGGRCRQ